MGWRNEWTPKTRIRGTRLGREKKDFVLLSVHSPPVRETETPTYHSPRPLLSPLRWKIQVVFSSKQTRIQILVTYVGEFRPLDDTSVLFLPTPFLCVKPFFKNLPSSLFPPPSPLPFSYSSTSPPPLFLPLLFQSLSLQVVPRPSPPYTSHRRWN